jgi:DNA-binding LacI/PurR family transcriptional regulator
MDDTRQKDPYYRQVANVLRAKIVSTVRDTPTRLPNERQLSIIHNVSRATVRKALDVLADEGLIDRSTGRGTITLPDGIRAWRRLRGSRHISLITSWQDWGSDPASYYGRIYQGILTSAEAAGYDLRIRHMSGSFPPFGPDYEPEDPLQSVGVIIGLVMDERVIATHANAGNLVVCVDYWSSNPKVDCVVVDCFSEGQAAAQFLASQGHQQFFYLGNIVGSGHDRKPEADADLMLAGCRRALTELGLSLPNSRVRYCRSNEVDRAIDWFTSLRPRPTAGVIFHAGVLKSFVQGLPDHGLDCPRDVSLITKDHIGSKRDAAMFQIDAFRMGQLAVELLIERASGKRKLPQVVSVRSTFKRGSTVRRV